MHHSRVAALGLSVFAVALAGCNGPAGPLATVGQTAEITPPTTYPPGPKNASDVNALLYDTAHKYQTLNSYSSLFTAERVNGSGLDPSTVKGKFFYLKPNRFIWSGAETFHDARTSKVTIVVNTHMVCDGATLLISTNKGVKKDVRLPAPDTPARMRDVIARVPFWDAVAHLVLGDKMLGNLLPANPMGANSPERFQALNITKAPNWHNASIGDVPVTRIRFTREDFLRRAPAPVLRYGYYQNFHISPDAVIHRFEATQFFGGARDRNKVDYTDIKFNPPLASSVFKVPDEVKAE
jgi:hypothetical protein